MTIFFRVYGVPVPEGSTRAFVVKGRPVVTHASKGLGAWRNAIADKVPADVKPGEGPFVVTLSFVLPRPKSLPKRVVAPTKRPDLDKLCRSVLDALTHVVWRDDSQVTGLVASKTYASDQKRPGVDVTIHDDFVTESVP